MENEELKKMIVAELGLGGLPPAEMDAIVEGVAANILDRLMIVILGKLPSDEAREKFTAMAEAGDLGALKAYTRLTIDGFDSLMRAEAQKELAAHKAEMEK